MYSMVLAMLTGIDGMPLGVDGMPLGVGLVADDSTVVLAWKSVTEGQGWAGAGTIVAALVYLLKRYDVKIPKVGAAIDKFLNQPMVSFCLPLLVSFAGAVGTAIAASQTAGVPLKLALVPGLWGALKVTGSAAVQFLLAKNLAEQASPSAPPSPPAGGAS